MAQASKGQVYTFWAQCAPMVKPRNATRLTRGLLLLLRRRLASMLERRSAMAHEAMTKASLLLFTAISMLSTAFVAATPLENVILGGQRQVRREERVHLGA